MTTFQLALLFFTCSICGCGSPDSKANSESNPPRLIEPGTVGARIWTESSATITIRTQSFLDAWGAGGQRPFSTESCRTASREELTESQLTFLQTIELVSLNDQCTSDGFSYIEIKVQDNDGTTSTFRDTGCDFLKVPSAKAILPSNLLASDFEQDQLRPC
jgi:hypothetical protein